MTPQVRVDLVPWDDPAAAALRAEQHADLARRDGVDEPVPPDVPVGGHHATLVLRVDDEPVGCVSLRDAAVHGGRFADRVGEVTSMVVRAGHRGRGLSRLLLARVEELAVERGLRRIVLEAGVRRPEAIGLYRSAGYRRIRCFGPYVDDPVSVCYAKWLVPDAVTRVLVVNGTVGAGKTTVVSAVAGLLRERGVPCSWLDVDALRHAYPTADDDPFAQAVVLDHLEAMAGVWRRRGYRRVVLAEIIERPEDRERYELAFDGADLAVVRLEASEPTRLARVTARELDPWWREWHLARTVELAAILETAGVDDAVVDNDARPLCDVAAEVLAAAEWE